MRGRPNRSGFTYVESDPPLTGEARERDYHRQYDRFRYATDANRRASVLARHKERYENDPAFRAACLEASVRWGREHPERRKEIRRASAERTRSKQRAKQLAVAREYGADL